MSASNPASVANNPVVSIITICRNAETVIEATMLSVLRQAYPVIEYIIVDGLSSDRTLTIAREVIARFPRRAVKIVSEKDQGISDAMNKGIRLASGSVITHLHAGDRYADATVIDKVMTSFQQEQWRWAVAASIVVDADGQSVHTYRADPNYRILLRKNCIPHQSTFLVKDIFDKYGLFRVDLKQAMDYEFWLRIAFKGNERYQVLPFAATYFLGGGRSAQINELLRYLRIVRHELREWVPDLTWRDDALFMLRVVLFHVYAMLKQLWFRSIGGRL